MSGEKVGIVGSGGREYELARQMSLAEEVDEVYVLNGNAGTELLPKTQNVSIKPTDIDGIVSFAEANDLDLTIIGPEAPLIAGVTDRLRAKGRVVFGPSTEAARSTEGSKAISLGIMDEFDIPHPPYDLVTTMEESDPVLRRHPIQNLILKADGLAGGKGVVPPESQEEAARVLHGMLTGESFDGAGRDLVVIQRRYHGPEVSALVVSDGKKFSVLPFSQDHKRLLDGDRGPNTGGMGAYAPLPRNIVSVDQEQKIYDIAERTIEAMAKKGIPYQGVLYLGLMLAEETDGDPVVIEYNARFGDPEAEVVLPLLSEAGVDVYGLMRSAAEGNLIDLPIPSELGKAALTVCLAVEGYPDNPVTGDRICGLNRPYGPGSIIHHAGTKRDLDGNILTAGGRVLFLTGIGETVDQAARKAEGLIGPIAFREMQFRNDIGHQVRHLY